MPLGPAVGPDSGSDTDTRRFGEYWKGSMHDLSRPVYPYTVERELAIDHASSGDVTVRID